MKSLDIAGAWVFEPVIHRDSRGSFRECFRGVEFAESTGYQFDLRQANCSVSNPGVVRGIHFTSVPPGQAKYVMCMSGAILDVIVDLRTGSPTFGQWVIVELDADSGRAAFISEGLGHAFMSVGGSPATVVYLCSTSYAPGIDRGISPLDPDIGITWPAHDNIVMSEKDAAAPALARALAEGWLPAYETCLEHMEHLRRHRGR